MIWRGGMSFHGGMLGVFLAMLLFSRRRGLGYFMLADIIGCAAPIGLFLGRIANFINGELYGRATDGESVPWAMVFPGGGPAARHPSQIYEALLEGLLLFVVLFLFVRRGALQRTGLLSGVFMIGYGLARMFVELFREPDQHLGFILPGVSMGQPLVPAHAAGRHRSCLVVAPRQGLTAAAASLARRIRAQGPISVADFMAEVLTHPRHGYYTTRDPFGAARPDGGDFTTAPEISQMFGELIGLWCLDCWQRLGSPPEILLIELGPGRGTLLADGLRAARVMPAFRRAVQPHLVEVSPLLRGLQQEALSRSDVGGPEPRWHDNLGQVPDGPALIVANEFFDALPIHQYQCGDGGWCERLVDLDTTDNAFAFTLSSALAPPRRAGPRTTARRATWQSRRSLSGRGRNRQRNRTPPRTTWRRRRDHRLWAPRTPRRRDPAGSAATQGPGRSGRTWPGRPYRARRFFGARGGGPGIRRRSPWPDPTGPLSQGLGHFGAPRRPGGHGTAAPGRRHRSRGEAIDRRGANGRPFQGAWPHRPGRRSAGRL